MYNTGVVYRIVILIVPSFLSVEVPSPLSFSIHKFQTDTKLCALHASWRFGAQAKGLALLAVSVCFGKEARVWVTSLRADRCVFVIGAQGSAEVFTKTHLRYSL